MLTDMLGELLEKATRVLSDEEKKVLEQDWVGKDGSKRKLEVKFVFRQILTITNNCFITS